MTRIDMPAHADAHALPPVSAPVPSEIPSRCAPRLACCLAALAAAAGTATAQPPYEDEPRVTTTVVLPGYLERSGHHRVGDPPALSGYELSFKVSSDQGDFSVRSIPMLAMRIREITTVAQASTQFARNTRAADDARAVERRRQRQAGGRTLTGLQEPEAGANSGVGGQLSNSAANNLIRFEGRRVITPDAPRAVPNTPPQLSPNDPTVQGHKRSVAAALGLDVYSTNPNVQALLDELALARATGQGQAGAISISLPGRPKARIANGRVDAAVRGALSRYSRQQLFERNSAALRSLDVSTADARAFMNTPTLSPRQRTEIVEHLAFMAGVDNRDAVVAGAATSSDEVEAERWAYAARALAHYHERYGPLARIVGAARVPVAETRDGVLAVLLPFDLVPWDRATARVFEGAARYAEKRGLERREVLTAGVLTPAARAGVEGKAFDVREHYLLEGSPARPPLRPAGQSGV